MAQAQTDPVADLLQKTSTTDAVRASAWDAFEQSANEEDFAAKLKTMPLPTHIKAQLWDLKAAAAPVPEPAPAPESPEAVTPGLTGRVLGAVGDVAIGAAKGAGQTATNLGRLVQKVPGVSRAVDALYSTPGLSEQAFTVADRVLAPTNTAQSIGKGVEQLAEVVVPGGAVSRSVAGARLLPKMATEAASLATLSTAQGGDPVTGAVVGAAIPAAGAALRAVPASLRASAEKKVAQALGATKERFKALAEKRAPEILKRGLGGSRSSLLADATAHAKEAGQAIDDVLKVAGDQRVPTGPVVDALEEAKAAFQQVRRLSIGEASRTGLARSPAAKVIGSTVEVPVVIDARPIEQLGKLQQTIRELGDDASVEQLVAVRRVWDDVVARAGGFAHRSGSQFGVPLAEQTEAWAKREATKSIREVLAEEVPDLAKVNAEYAFWKDLKDVLTATQKRTQAQKTGLASTVASIVGAGAGFGSGDDLGERVKYSLYGMAGGQAYRLLTSASWRFVSAHLRNRLADALESGNTGRVMSAVAQVAGVKASQVNQGETIASPERASASGPR